MRWSVRTLSVLLVILAGACGDPPAPEGPPVRPVKVLTLGEASGGIAPEYPGAVRAGTDADLSFERGGKVSVLHVDQGQDVKAGTVLAELDARDQQADVASAKARLDQAKADLDRYEQLFVANATSQQDLERKRAAFEVTRADYQQAAKALQDAKLVAPFDGTIARKHVDAFQQVQAKQAVFTLQDTTSLEVAVSVPERDWARRPPGLSRDALGETLNPRVVVASASDTPFPARLSKFDAAADPATRTFEVRFAFDPPEGSSVAPGMTAKVVLDPPKPAEGAADVVEVPLQAVGGADDGHPYVWVVDTASNTVSRRDVELGLPRGELVRIASGLEGDETIVTSGVQHLRDGQAIKVLSEEGA